MCLAIATTSSALVLPLAVSSKKKSKTEKFFLLAPTLYSIFFHPHLNCHIANSPLPSSQPAVQMNILCRRKKRKMSWGCLMMMIKEKRRGGKFMNCPHYCGASRTMCRIGKTTIKIWEERRGEEKKMRRYERRETANLIFF